MTESSPRFAGTISLGNVIQIATMLVVFGMAYSDLRAEDRVLSDRIETMRQQRVEDQVRTDTRWREVQQALSRIEARLEGKADKAQ